MLALQTLRRLLSLPALFSSEEEEEEEEEEFEEGFTTTKVLEDSTLVM